LDQRRGGQGAIALRIADCLMTEITFLLGFTDSSNFTRAFKRWTGTSPTNFKSSVPE
jgi:AraC-like DNA-binding protein